MGKIANFWNQLFLRSYISLKWCQGIFGKALCIRHGESWVSMSLSYCYIPSLHFHMAVPIIYDWHLQLVQCIFCCDRPWSALTGGFLRFIWFQESQTPVYALIYFHLLLWIPLFFYSPGGPHSKPAGSQLSILVIWHYAYKKRKPNQRASLCLTTPVSKGMRFRSVIGQYRVTHEVASSQHCRN